jgi:antitoxin MazE
MTMLTKIGNSQGVRIPKALIQQAHLENVKLDFEVVDDGLLIKPVTEQARKNWEADIQNTLSKNDNKPDEALLGDMLDDSDLEAYTW